MVYIFFITSFFYAHKEILRMGLVQPKNGVIKNKNMQGNMRSKKLKYAFNNFWFCGIKYEILQNKLL